MLEPSGSTHVIDDWDWSSVMYFYDPPGTTPDFENCQTIGHHFKDLLALIVTWKNENYLWWDEEMNSILYLIFPFIINDNTLGKLLR